MDHRWLLFEITYTCGMHHTTSLPFRHPPAHQGYLPALKGFLFGWSLLRSLPSSFISHNPLSRSISQLCVYLTLLRMFDSYERKTFTVSGTFVLFSNQAHCHWVGGALLGNYENPVTGLKYWSCVCRERSASVCVPASLDWWFLV